MSKIRPIKKTTHPAEIRLNKVTISLSDKELKAIDEYAKKHRKRSRAATIRECAVRFAMGKLVDNFYPSLFDQCCAEDENM